MGNELALTKVIGVTIVPITNNSINNKIDFSERRIDKLYHLLIECKTNSRSQKKLIAKINNLIGGLL